MRNPEYHWQEKGAPPASAQSLAELLAGPHEVTFFYTGKKDAHGKTATSSLSVIPRRITTSTFLRFATTLSVAAEGSYELNVNGIFNWLTQNGERHGWHSASAEQAQTWANSGKPEEATFNNPRGIGHVAMICSGPYDKINGPFIAQAGGKNLNSARVVEGFHKTPVIYWVHD